MAEHKTQPYRNTFSGSVGAGMGALFNPKGKTYYILEHKVSSRYHKAGESQEIIVDNIEIGRDPRCQVRFDDSEKFRTVSRHHAAIVRDGDGWKLIQLSKVNSTLLNGRRVEREWYLQNGDEIQLSINGPKLGFIVPSGKNSTVASIGLTRRLSLFRQQALRPYKRAIAVLAAVLVVTAASLTTWNLMLQKNLTKNGKQLAAEIEKNIQNAEKVAELTNELEENNKKYKDAEERLAAASKQIAGLQYQVSKLKNVGPDVSGLPKECSNNTYYIQFIISFNGQPVYGCSGTGFLLDDGRFVTAQHVVNPFMGGIETNDDCYLNAIMNAYPDKFQCQLAAISASGDRITQNYSLANSPFHMGSLEKVTLGTIEIEGMTLPVKVVTRCDWRDYAFIRTSKSGGLAFDDALSTSMPVKTHLDILGFPKGVGAENASSISPLYTESSVAREGVDVDGCILLSNSETDHGNSGGPVWTTKDGKYVIVGILSGANRLGSKNDPRKTDGKWKDRVVPIGKVK